MNGRHCPRNAQARTPLHRTANVSNPKPNFDALTLCTLQQNKSGLALPGPWRTTNPGLRGNGIPGPRRTGIPGLRRSDISGLWRSGIPGLWRNNPGPARKNPGPARTRPSLPGGKVDGLPPALRF